MSIKRYDPAIRPGDGWYDSCVEFDESDTGGWVHAEDVPQWISISDRLPAQDGHLGHVLVARTLPHDPRFGDRDVTMGYLSNTGWRDDHGSIENDGAKVTHWMPFPEPPPA